MARTKELKKAFLSQRLVAFILDMVLVSIIATVLTFPFVNNDKIDKLGKEGIEIVNKYQSGKIDEEAYVIEYSNVYYNLSKENGITALVTIFLQVLYFVVYQIYRGGQTIGKKIMKIKVISNDGDLTMNQMIFRSFLSNFILLNILNFMFLLFVSKNGYLMVVSSVGTIQYILAFVSIIMVASKKCGYAIHDKLVHTTVIREN